MAISRPKIIRTIRNIVISFVTIFGLIIVAGIGYTWYAGQQKLPSEPTADKIEPATATPVIKPTQPAANANVGAAIENITSPVAPGANTSITIQTNPKANCTISVVYDKTASTDSGLKSRQADEYGVVSWTWTVGESVPLGTWPVKVSCVSATSQKSAFVQGDLKVAKL